jgi:hypothetical protein
MERRTIRTRMNLNDWSNNPRSPDAVGPPPHPLSAWATIAFASAMSLLASGFVGIPCSTPAVTGQRAGVPVAIQLQR